MTNTTKGDAFSEMMNDLEDPHAEDTTEWEKREDYSDDEIPDFEDKSGVLNEDFEEKTAGLGRTIDFSDDFVESMSRDDIMEALDKKITNTSITVKGTIENVVTILARDERFAGRIAFHTRRRAPVIVKSIDFGIPFAKEVEVNEDRGYVDLSDSHATRMRRVCEASKANGGYEMEGLNKEKVAAGIDGVAEMRDFDPVMDIFNAEPWDGVERLSNLFVKYLGAEDNAFNREAAEIMMTGLAARTFEPGCNFQHFIVICGRAEGSGKSEFLKLLSGGHYKQVNKGELKNTKEMAVEFRGPSILIHDELVAINELTYEECNLFLEMSFADARLPYGQRSEYFPFPFIHAGTTNDTQFMRSPNSDGGRRYSPIMVSEEFNETNKIANNELRENIPQIYAEAKARYLKMREDKPKGSLEFSWSRKALEIKRRITEMARAETDDSTLSGLIRSVVMAPINQDRVKEIKSLRKWDTDYMEIDGTMYRRSWNRAALLNAVRDAHPENQIIQDEITKSGKGSNFKKVIDEISFISKGSSKTIHGLEAFGQQQTYKIEPRKFAETLALLREMNSTVDDFDEAVLGDDDEPQSFVLDDKDTDQVPF